MIEVEYVGTKPECVINLPLGVKHKRAVKEKLVFSKGSPQKMTSVDAEALCLKDPNFKIKAKAKKQKPSDEVAVEIDSSDEQFLARLGG